MLKRQTKYFTIGLLCLILAMFCITFLPVILKLYVKNIIFQNYIYVQIEFFLLAVCSIFYLFSPKYYFSQVVSIIFGIFYYLMFVKAYPFIF